jgi:hypothetical protein
MSSAGLGAGLLLSMMLVTTAAQADVQDVTVETPCLEKTGANADTSYAAMPGDVVNKTIGVVGAGATVEWAFDAVESDCTQTSDTAAKCAGSLVVTIPSGTVPPAMKPTLTGNPTSLDVIGGPVTLRVTDQAGKCGSRKYQLHVTSTGGGWGDPHMSTVDGVHYDFQGAGEFTALRTALRKGGLEIQTRQRPVSSVAVGPVNEHTGLGTCVSIYSAVAMRIGSNRVTLQPNLSGEPDPKGLQLRVNGNLVTLTDSGIDLRAGGVSDAKALLEGRIVKAAGGAYEFDNAFGTQLVATPAYWDAQKTWYLNLNVYQTTGTRGIWGLIPRGSWLPALPDGTTVGQMPEALDQRYQTLYTTFGGAWRVTDATSLFDYAPGTNTATFTTPYGDWPRFNPQSCVIEGQTPAQPGNPQVAAQACSGITDANQKADCIFDVTVTGETGFAQTYQTMQGFRPHGTGWQPVLAGVNLPPQPGWPWWLWIVILILVLIAIAAFIARRLKIV